jgi:hypothetical protein
MKIYHYILVQIVYREVMLDRLNDYYISNIEVDEMYQMNLHMARRKKCSEDYWASQCHLLDYLHMIVFELIDPNNIDHHFPVYKEKNFLRFSGLDLLWIITESL